MSGGGPPLRVDGGRGEGGGQVLRTALALGALTGRTVEIHRIRAARSRPGLAPQHLAGARAVAAVCGGALDGDRLRSERVVLEPGPVRSGEYLFDVARETPSAGAATLVLQAILPLLAVAPGPSRVVLRGGTHVPWSPPVHFTQRVLAPALAFLGMGLQVELRRWGLYPKGGGELAVQVQPAPRLEPVAWEAVSMAAPLPSEPDAVPGPPSPIRVRGVAAAVGLARQVARAHADAARSAVLEHLPAADVVVETTRVDGPGKGSACLLFTDGGAGHLPPAGFSALGGPDDAGGRAGLEAARALLAHRRSGATVDLHLADQVVPFLALAAGESSFTTPECTSHLTTVCGLCEEILGAGIEVQEGAPVRLRVHGVGLR